MRFVVHFTDCSICVCSTGMRAALVIWWLTTLARSEDFRSGTEAPGGLPRAHGACSIRILTESCCSRQEPLHASDPRSPPVDEYPDRLVADIGRLRGNLGIERWLVYGASWGSILVLTYAERHPERATEMVIAAVPMTRRSEIQWLYHGVGRFFRAEWARFRDGVPAGDRDGDLVEAYTRLLAHSDAQCPEQAARNWCD